MRKIGFIGAGNMTATIIDGLVSRFDQINDSIFVTNRSREKLEKLCRENGVNALDTNIQLAKQCDVIVLGIKPNIYPVVLNEISPFINEDQLLVSIAAGITIDEIQGYFSNPQKIIRIMPNVAVSVGEGMLPMSSSPHATQEDIDITTELFSSIGRVDLISEHLMDAATCVSGCSPAFIAQMVEAMADGAVLQGMPREKAYQYAAQTLVGTGLMILKKELHPGPLKDMVTSPGGVTIEGVYSLEKNGFRGIVMEALEVCSQKLKTPAKK